MVTSKFCKQIWQRCSSTWSSEQCSRLDRDTASGLRSSLLILSGRVGRLSLRMKTQGYQVRPLFTALKKARSLSPSKLLRLPSSQTFAKDSQDSSARQTTLKRNRPLKCCRKKTRWSIIRRKSSDVSCANRTVKEKSQVG